MKFQPLNKHIEVEPIEEGGIISSQTSTYEEKGKVLSYADDCDYGWDAGDVVFFDAWMCAKYKDSAGRERWLVPEESIRAYESTE